MTPLEKFRSHGRAALAAAELPREKKNWRKKLIFPYVRHAKIAMTVAQEPQFASEKLFLFLIFNFFLKS